MGMANTSVIMKTVILGHFLSSIDKIKYKEAVFTEKKTKTPQETALSPFPARSTSLFFFAASQ